MRIHGALLLVAGSAATTAFVTAGIAVVPEQFALPVTFEPFNVSMGRWPWYYTGFVYGGQNNDLTSRNVPIDMKVKMRLHENWALWLVVNVQDNLGSGNTITAAVAARMLFAEW
jgi:hypothetical protein